MLNIRNAYVLVWNVFIHIWVKPPDSLKEIMIGCIDTTRLVKDKKYYRLEGKRVGAALRKRRFLRETLIEIAIRNFKKKTVKQKEKVFFGGNHRSPILFYFLRNFRNQREFIK